MHPSKKRDRVATEQVSPPYKMAKNGQPSLFESIMNIIESLEDIRNDAKTGRCNEKGLDPNFLVNHRVTRRALHQFLLVGNGKSTLALSYVLLR